MPLNNEYLKTTLALRSLSMCVCVCVEIDRDTILNAAIKSNCYTRSHAVLFLLISYADALKAKKTTAMNLHHRI